MDVSAVSKNRSEFIEIHRAAALTIDLIGNLVSMKYFLLSHGMYYALM
jgi:hypothetical protein